MEWLVRREAEASSSNHKDEATVHRMCRMLSLELWGLIRSYFPQVKGAKSIHALSAPYREVAEGSGGPFIPYEEIHGR